MIALENQWFVQMSLDCRGQMCLLPSLRLTRLLQKEKSRRRKVDQSALQWVLSRLFLRVSCSLFYIAGFVRSVVNFPSLCRWCRNNSGSFRNEGCLHWRGDWWTVEEVSHSVYQEPRTVNWGPQHDVPEAVHSPGWIRGWLEQAFDDGNICVQMRNLLVLL